MAIFGSQAALFYSSVMYLRLSYHLRVDLAKNYKLGQWIVNVWREILVYVYELKHDDLDESFVLTKVF